MQDTACNLTEGLPREAVEILNHGAHNRRLLPGQIIFRERDPVQGLFYVQTGWIEIYRTEKKEHLQLNMLGPGEIFGELGLLIDPPGRTASARAHTEATVLELPGNPLEMLHRLCGPQSALLFAQNLMRVLAQRLRDKDAMQPHAGTRGTFKLFADYCPDPDKALDIIERALPHGFIRRFFAEKNLQPGDILCRKGDPSDGFYFIHRGAIDVYSEREPHEDQKLNRIMGPWVAGETGFFAGRPRSATLAAVTQVHYTHFTPSDFRALAKHNPEEALAVLRAAAQLVVLMLIEKERGS